MEICAVYLSESEVDLSTTQQHYIQFESLDPDEEPKPNRVSPIKLLSNVAAGFFIFNIFKTLFILIHLVKWFSSARKPALLLQN